MKYDVAVVGAGVVGALISRELSKYDIRVALLEKCNDVAMGTTKANSAIVHGGFDAANGTLKAKLNVRGTELMPKICAYMAVPYRNNGSLVLAFSEEEMEHVYSESLPLGVMRGQKIEKSSRELASGDMVIMMTDGVLDALPVGEQDFLLETIIKGTEIRNPKELARHILQQVLNWTGKEPEDDMSVLVAALWKCRK